MCSGKLETMIVKKSVQIFFVQIEGLSFDYYFGGAILEIFESSALMQNSWKQKKRKCLNLVLMAARLGCDM